MTNKEKAIKELKEALDSLDITNKYRLNLIRAIEYLQEEPRSKNLEEEAEKLNLKLVEQSGLGSTIDILYDGKPIKRVEI